VLIAACTADGRPLGARVLDRLTHLLGVFVAGSFYFTVVFHLTNLYITRTHGIERFVLLDGGIHTALFWLGQVGIGYVLPLILIFSPGSMSRGRVLTACTMIVLGGLAQMYVTIIGAQAYPLDIFPGYEVKSSFFDGEVHGYVPSAWELMLGVGGIAVAAALVVVALRVLRLLPERLDDASVSAWEAH